MKLFLSYLRTQAKIIGLFMLFEITFMGVTALYQVPAVVSLYPGTLCLGAGLGALWVDFSKIRKKHRELMALSNAEDVAAASFSEPRGILEEDYQFLLKELGRRQQAELGQREQKMRDTLEYYTVWAHQIKTPIASMALRLQKEDSALSRQLAAELNRIEQYVQMAMTFLRLDSDTTDYCFREYNLDDIVRPSLRRFAGEFITRKLKLCYEPLETRVITDEKWLAFVVEQVLSNALKYTPSGEIKIYMEQPCCLCVADTGIGIDPSDLPRIFEKGYTGFNGRSDRRASGLGLYLCRRILTCLGHGISAESTPGAGTVIRIYLGQKQMAME